jgi:hypothetical protein
VFCPDLYKLGYLGGLKKFYHQDEEKVVEQLCKDLKPLYNKAFYNLNRYIKLKPLTKEHEESFNKADKYCNQEFTVDNKKCRHHDHTTGEYIGAYCNSCNLKIKYINFKVRVVFHNMKGYDGHFLIRLAINVLKVPAKYQFILVLLMSSSPISSKITLSSWIVHSILKTL